jgi:hypothetical protein
MSYLSCLTRFLWWATYLAWLDSCISMMSYLPCLTRFLYQYVFSSFMVLIGPFVRLTGLLPDTNVLFDRYWIAGVWEYSCWIIKKVLLIISDFYENQIKLWTICLFNTVVFNLKKIRITEYCLVGCSSSFSVYCSHNMTTSVNTKSMNPSYNSTTLINCPILFLHRSNRKQITPIG